VERYAEVDAHLAGALLRPDPVMDGVLAANAAAGLPAIDVSPLQGKLLHLLARAVGARRILEVGTLGGYSTVWLARALPPDGRLTTLEVSPRHAAVARTNLERAGLADRVDVVVGDAVDSLALLQGPVDLVFVDADKPGNPVYAGEALRLLRPGGLLVVDNTVRGGAVATGPEDDAVRGVHALHDLLRSDPRVDATAIQTVGVKGHDGFTLAVRLPPVH
jgi:predicted O-methyltransferase YrrM